MPSERAAVSVIIPCFRCTCTVERAVLSVIHQTLPPAELLIVNDAGDEETLRKLNDLQAEWGSLLPMEVIPLRHQVGPGLARNMGWDRSRQPYVAFLDADDAWHPQKLEVQYRWMTANPDIDLCGHERTRVIATEPARLLLDSWTVSEVGWLKLLMRNVFPTSSVMLSRTLPFRFGEGYAEDQLLWLRIVLSGRRACKLNVPLSYIYNPPYGHSGLTADLWRMEKAELMNYRRLHEDGLIGAALYRALLPYSLAKHLRRLLVTSWNELGGAYDA